MILFRKYDNFVPWKSLIGAININIFLKVNLIILCISQMSSFFFLWPEVHMDAPRILEDEGFGPLFVSGGRANPLWEAVDICSC